MTETILILLAAFGIGFYHDANRATQYELELSDGNKASVIIKKNGKYSCPKYCDVDHSHTVEVCEDGCKKHHHNHYIHNYKVNRQTNTVIAGMKYGDRDINTLTKIYLNKKK
mgnify:CR=1 FL=1|tara:strand:+ start:315 stop:650 length:336 start_codon:yes stop_codon:yes gene_type:complete